MISKPRDYLSVCSSRDVELVDKLHDLFHCLFLHLHGSHLEKQHLPMKFTFSMSFLFNPIVSLIICPLITFLIFFINLNSVHADAGLRSCDGMFQNFTNAVIGEECLHLIYTVTPHNLLL